MRQNNHRLRAMSNAFVQLWHGACSIQHLHDQEIFRRLRWHKADITQSACARIKLNQLTMGSSDARSFVETILADARIKARR